MDCSCGSKKSFRDVRTQELICSECGMVLEPPPMLAPTTKEGEEWIAKPGYGPPSRSVVMNPLSMGSVDAQGNAIDFKRRQDLWRLTIEDKRDIKARKGTLLDTKDFQWPVQEASLPKHIADSAWLLYQKWHAKEKLQGTPSTACIAACIYLAARTEGNVVEVVVLGDILQVEPWRIWSVIKRIKKATGIKAGLGDGGLAKLVFAASQKLGVGEDVRRAALAWAEKGRGRVYVPSQLIAASFRLAIDACGVSKTDEAVAAACGVGQRTMMNAVAELLNA